MTAAAAPTPEERRQRMRDYIVNTAAERDWYALWPTVVGTRAQFLDAVDRVSQRQAEWKPAGEEWSILEVVRHALNASRDVLRVIEGLAAGEHASRSTGPGAQPADAPFDLAELRGPLTEHSLHFASLPARLPATTNLTLTAPHAFFGELNARAWFLFQHIHDTDHMNQVAKIRSAAGFPAD